ncbi:regulatory protein MarR [Coriobacterium glomerans PW2]|uniref:Regulatory protein MarR n=1 Tax=Coriobacterium glomerans (strain ATCC 49209 / DSM 20642 / JCM 10262 / PW2) TaxID=700015 RepID=F2N9Z2_CORGP|nr:MarR family transcriptional regulator [Coriobacterium glomerans]AEB06247.1 regulatory protein MarR [Coriobacterium glomerans PW2]
MSARDAEPPEEARSESTHGRSQTRTSSDPVLDRANRILHGLGYCGHFLHFHAGGRSGRAPMLCLLAKYGGKMAQQEIGRHFDIQPGSLSEILAKLEADGLIERTRDRQDRRQLSIQLTQSGFKQAEQERCARERFKREAFSYLSEHEQVQLGAMLEAIRAAWEELDD